MGKIAMVKGKVLTEKIALCVRPEVKAVFERARSKGFNWSEELRKKAEILAQELERELTG